MKNIGYALIFALAAVSGTGIYAFRPSVQAARNQKLHEAVLKGDLNGINDALAKGADVNHLSAMYHTVLVDGWDGEQRQEITVLIVAACAGLLDVVKTLLEVPGIDVNMLLTTDITSKSTEQLWLDRFIPVERSLTASSADVNAVLKDLNDSLTSYIKSGVKPYKRGELYTYKFQRTVLQMLEDQGSLSTPFYDEIHALLVAAGAKSIIIKK